MRAIQIKRYGGPEVLEYGELPDPAPAAGEALVRVRVAGVNFTDVYQRAGTYPGPLPFIPGVEGVGIVEKLGSGVTEVKVGDRVGWVMIKGGYAELVALPAKRLVPIPASVDDRTAAAILLQGMTAHFLSTDCYRVQKGEWILIHAAAGGVGLLLTQLAHRIGARIIGTTSTEEKAALAREAGADEIVLYTKDDFQEAARRITGGEGVSVVYDSVGKTTFLKSLDSLRPRGYMVLFGGSSGPAPTIDPMILNPKGSLFLTRPTLGNYVSSRDELMRRASDIFEWVSKGELTVRAEHDYPLAEAAQAQADMEARKTTGKILLTI
ncbi:MAG TPA: quinone oxidoreductase [Gemmatimonadaceae bacterium]|jgi:NADPH2:quinone reductase|nr:quinone oxidoreductase [Gemmatimonadaceae bacterium]